jgi:methionine-rich copper-binding protein CopC
VITVFAAILTFVALLLVGGPASAHDQLLSSDPKDGATLDEHPATISLTFSASPLDTGIEVALVGSHGRLVAESENIQVDDKVVTAQLAEGMPPGEYTVAWHVVSSDGHPIDGEFTYTVEGQLPEGEEEPEMSTQEAEPTEAATTEAEPTATDGAEQPTTPAELAGAGDGAGVSGLAVTGGLVAAVLVVLGVVVMMRRKILENDRLRRAGEPDPEEPAGEKPNANPDDKPKI